MRNRIIGAIGILWGGAILLRYFLNKGSVDRDAAYASGQKAAVVFGALLFVAGLYYFMKKRKQED
jgi:LPXTG-motif cell wall-anchored protein